MTGRAPVGRQRCAACLRPVSHCLCHWVSPVEHTTQVLILQHPLETFHAKNSARLLHLCLANSQLHVGEVFEPGQLRRWLEAPGRNVLLYPADAHGLIPAPVFAGDPPHADAAPARLVVLDATWRKSRKMLHLNPLLQELPRMSLEGVPPSVYRMRKAHRPDQLSTLEATCTALGRLEGDPERFAPLLQAFDGMVARHLSYCPTGPARAA